MLIQVVALLALGLQVSAEPVSQCRFWNHYIRDSNNLCLFYQCAPQGRDEAGNWFFYPQEHPCAPGTSVIPGFEDKRAGQDDILLNPDGSPYDANPCEGPSLPDCIAAGWGQWTSFSTCSASCGPGVQRRERFCPAGGNCPGDAIQTQPCNLGQCTTISQWGPWGIDDLQTGQFIPGGCSRACDGGEQFRFRTCVGNNCAGVNLRERRPCNTQPCPPEVSEWTGWGAYYEDVRLFVLGACSRACGGGTQNRTRTCIGNCAGVNLLETRPCNTQQCAPLLDQWSAWGADDPNGLFIIGSCSRQCDGGIQYRTRGCQGNCAGLNLRESRPCNTQPCPPTITQWGAWGADDQLTGQFVISACSAPCNGGTQYRLRSCIGNCIGVNLRETRPCNTQPCSQWGSWNAWTLCSVNCDGPGTRTRSRNCNGGAPGSPGCPGSAEEVDNNCNTQPCPCVDSPFINLDSPATGDGDWEVDIARTCENIDDKVGHYAATQLMCRTADTKVPWDESIPGDPGRGSADSPFGIPCLAKGTASTAFLKGFVCNNENAMKIPGWEKGCPDYEVAAKCCMRKTPPM